MAQHHSASSSVIQRGTAPHGGHRGAILELIRRGAAPTRRHVAEHTGLSRSSVAQAVAELIEEGLVVERMSGPHGSRGRPTATLRAADRRGWVAAVDFGHRHVGVALAGLDARVLVERRVEFDVDGSASSAFDAARDLLDAGLRELGIRNGDLSAMAVAAPFPVVTAGAVRAPGRLTSWANASPADALARGGGYPVIVDNDANLGAWGEHVHGAGRGLSSLLYIKAADGVGAGLVIDGVVFNGTRGVGGEMGHVQVDRAGERCRCGRTGCLEAVISPAAIRRRLAAIAPGELFGASWSPTEATRAVFVDAGRAIGRVAAQLCNFLDPDAVVVGGRLGVVGEPILQGMRDAFDEYREVSPIHDVRFLTAQLGERAEITGAIDRAVQRAWSAPAPVVRAAV